MIDLIMDIMAIILILYFLAEIIVYLRNKTRKPVKNKISINRENILKELIKDSAKILYKNDNEFQKFINYEGYHYVSILQVSELIFFSTIEMESDNFKLEIIFRNSDTMLIKIFCKYTFVVTYKIITYRSVKT